MNPIDDEWRWDKKSKKLTLSMFFYSSDGIECGKNRGRKWLQQQQQQKKCFSQLSVNSLSVCVFVT